MPVNIVQPVRVPQTIWQTRMRGTHSLHSNRSTEIRCIFEPQMAAYTSWQHNTVRKLSQLNWCWFCPYKYTWKWTSHSEPDDNLLNSWILSYSNNAMNASGCTSNIWMGSFFSGSVPLNMASKTGDAMAKTSLCPATSCWLFSDPTRKWQSAHLPVFNKYSPRRRISLQDVCQSIDESIVFTNKQFIEQIFQVVLLFNWMLCFVSTIHLILFFFYKIVWAFFDTMLLFMIARRWQWHARHSESGNFFAFDVRTK